MNKMSSSFPALTLSESTLFVKMSFLRKYFAALFIEYLLMSVICSIIMLTPLARFYVTENDWLVLLCCFLFCVTYLSLAHFIKLPVIDLILMLHILIQAFAVSLLVTFNDWMYIYQGIIMTTCTIFGFVLYTLQSKLNFNIWTVMAISCICLFLTSTCLKAVFGGTEEESIFSILTSFFIIFYHSYAIFQIIITFTPADCTLALINVHLLPVNWCMFSSLLYKP